MLQSSDCVMGSGKECASFNPKVLGLGSSFVMLNSLQLVLLSMYLKDKGMCSI